MKTKIKSKSGIIGQIFSCSDCDKSWEDYRNARKQAYLHASRTGHHVVGEITTVYSYNEPEKK